MALRKWPRRLGYGLGALVLLVALGYAVALWRYGQVAARRYDGPALALAAAPAPSDTTGAGPGAAADSARLARGAHLIRLGCQECHGEDLGGLTLADAPPALLATPNLTRGGVGARLTPATAERALRHGFGVDGRPLFIMPVFAALADEDIRAIVAHLQSLPPVARPSGQIAFKPLGKVLVGLGQFPPEADRIVRVMDPPAAAPPTGTAEEGRYLVAVTCVHCHGADLRGAPHPDPAGLEGPSLDAAAGWSPEQFRTAIREGKRPSGPPMDPKWMPWTYFKNLTDAEIAGLHAHLRQHFGKPPASTAAR